MMEPKDRNIEALRHLARRRQVEASAKIRNTEQALLYWQDATRILEGIGEAYHPDHASYYLGLASALQTQERHGKAMEVLYRLLDSLQPHVNTPFSHQSQKALQLLAKRQEHQGEWYKAIMALQWAARMEAYAILRPSGDEQHDGNFRSENIPTYIDDSSTGADRLESNSLDMRRLNSVKNMRKLLQKMEEKYPKQTKKNVWSFFPKLAPGRPLKEYLDVLEATVRHEVQGDWNYQKGHYEVALFEYQTALRLYQNQVHKSKDAKRSIIPVDNLWIFRKIALSAFAEVIRTEVKANPLSLDKVLTSDFDDERPYCQVFARVCKNIRQADSLLQRGTWDDNDAHMKAWELYEESLLFHGIYKEVEATLRRPNISVYGEVAEVLDNLRYVVAPSWSSEDKTAWKALEYSAILLERSEHQSTRLPHSASTPNHQDGHSTWLRTIGVWLLIFGLVLPIVLPVLRQRTALRKKKVKTVEATRRSTSISKDFPPFTEAQPEEKTLDSDVVVEFRRLLEALKQVEDALNEKPCRLDPQDVESCAELSGRKVTLLVALERTRKFVGSQQIEGKDGLEAAIEELCSLHVCVGRLGLAHWLCGKATIISHYSGMFTDRDLKYHFCSWNSLPRNVQKAAEFLGYSGKSWDETFSLSEGYHELSLCNEWGDLSPEETTAVGVLGWDEDSWAHCYDYCSWQDLPDLQLRAAMIVGFNDLTWNNNEWPESLNKPWLKLTRLERRALSVLGWIGQDWDCM